MNRVMQPKHIPLLFSVTIIAGIFYHYKPLWTPVWILLSIAIQGGLFRLFDYIKKHKFLGSIAYLAVGFAFLAASSTFIRLGNTAAIFAPDRIADRIPFWVWFLTPQSVLSAAYVGYTIALFLLFTFFIASITYYFTFVRYRVLMSFVVMVFPFAIYAKENETMPVLSIIILLFCYFAVMIYCRQAHAEDREVVQIYRPDTVSELAAPGKKSAYAQVKPEILDQRFLQAAGIFLSAASVLILILPKPNVHADRSRLDTMVDLTRLSNYLENAIGGFSDNSDGGNYAVQSYPRTLYYCIATEPLNLRVQTFTEYNYQTDSWSASYEDGKDYTDISAILNRSKKMKTACYDQNPADLYAMIRKVAEDHPDLTEKWNLSEFLAAQPEPKENFCRELTVVAAAPSRQIVSPAPLHTFDSNAQGVDTLYQNKTGIVFGDENAEHTMTFMQSSYFSDTFSATEEAQALMKNFTTETWADFLEDLLFCLYPSENIAENADILSAIMNFNASALCREANAEEITEPIRALAAQITKGKNSDFEKAAAICDYLKSGEYVYSLSAPRPANTEAFLMKDKAGVCYQFATAMTQLCRASGLSARYVEGYMMSEAYTSESAMRFNYSISTRHAHAFCDVYIAGYGWMMMDATALSYENQGRSEKVLKTLQVTGVILLGAGLILFLLLFRLIPFIRERLFRRKFRKEKNAASVQEAFARLRKQWRAESAKTARDICAKQGAFLQMDLSNLLTGFEEATYAERCTPETAERVYHTYCKAYDSYPAAVRRERRKKREEQHKQKKLGASKL